jgi:signal transduction histidine kinase
MMRDITERMQMVDRIYAQDRLASIGKLTAGVAHEINNPLAIMKGLAELLIDTDIPESAKADIRIIDSEVDRVSTVVQNLLVFARKQESDKVPTNINRLLSQTLNLEFYEQNTQNIRIVPHFARDLPKVFVNEAQITQVFVNLFMNEKDILRDEKGGTISITTEEVPGYVCIKIKDDGPGISHERLSHIFEPFYMKEVGQGAGLGLSICHGIITEHGGEISAESTEGKGTTFTIKLPAYKEVERLTPETDSSVQKIIEN